MEFPIFFQNLLISLHPKRMSRIYKHFFKPFCKLYLHKIYSSVFQINIFRIISLCNLTDVNFYADTHIQYNITLFSFKSIEKLINLSFNYVLFIKKQNLVSYCGKNLGFCSLATKIYWNILELLEYIREHNYE